LSRAGHVFFEQRILSFDTCCDRSFAPNLPEGHKKVSIVTICLLSYFEQVVVNAKTISCSTAEISGLSERAGEAIAQALDLTNDMIQDTLEAIRQEIDGLFALADAVVGVY
jgi:hypothetical protein